MLCKVFQGWDKTVLRLHFRRAQFQRRAWRQSVFQSSIFSPGLGSCAEAELIPKAMSMLSFQLLLTPSSNPDSPTVCAVDTQTWVRAELRRERSGESRCGSKFPSHSLCGLFMRGTCDSPACQQILWLWLSPSTIWMLSARAAALLTFGLWMQTTRHREPWNCQSWHQDAPVHPKNNIMWFHRGSSSCLQHSDTILRAWWNFLSLENVFLKGKHWNKEESRWLRNLGLLF